jgi:hypothetical protein
MWDFIEATGRAIRAFLEDVTEYETTSSYRSSIVEAAIKILDDVPGMTPCLQASSNTPCLSSL